MLSIDGAVRFLERATDAKCFERFDDPEDGGRIVLRFQHADNRTKVNLERRRLRQIDRNDTRGVTEIIRASLHREVRSIA
jgi:hypothetical protein